MGYDGSLKFDTEIDEKGFNDGTAKLGKIAKGGAGIVTKAMVATTAALGAGVTMGVKYNAEMQNFFSDFKVMLGSAEEATKFVNNLKEMAAKTPFEMKDLANASKILLAFGSDAQSAQEQIKMLGDISLGNAEKMKTLSTAFGRIQSNGRASMEEINMMIDSGFNPLNLIAEKTGESMEKLRKRVSEGGVSFEEISDAMEQATSKGGQFYKGMEEASKTLTGQFSTLKDNVNSLLGEMTSGIADMLTNNLVPSAIDAIGELISAFQSGGFKGLAVAGVNIVKNIITGISSSLPVMIRKGYEILNNLITGFVDAIPEALPKVLGFIQGIGEKIEEYAPMLVQKGFEMLSKLVEGIVTAIPILIAKVPTIISTFANVINDNFPTILMKGVQLIGQLVLGIIQAIPTLVANVPKIIKAIVDVWSAFNWLNLGKKAIGFLKDGIVSMIGIVKNAGTNIANAVKNAILNLPATLKNIGQAAMSGLGNAIRGAVGLVKNAAKTIFDAIINSFKSLPGKMLDIGKNIVKGIWNGISNMGGWIAKKIGSFGDGIVKGFKKTFGIHSPSKVTEKEVGQWLAKGVGVGFEKNIPLKGMTSSVKNAITDMQKVAFRVTSSVPITAKVARNMVTNNFTDVPIDYTKIKKAQLDAMNKANDKPIILNGRQVNRAIKDGGVVYA